MRNVIVTIMSLFVFLFAANAHAEEELIWNPTHILGSMVIGYADFFVQEDGSETGVFTTVLERNTEDNELFEQLIVIGIPGSDQAVVIGIPVGAGGVAATPIVIPRPAGGAGAVGATPINVPSPVINNFSSVAHIDHWSQGGIEGEGVDSLGHIDHWSETELGFENPAMEFDPVPEPPPEGYDPSWELGDVAGSAGLVGEVPEPGGTPPGPNMFE
ncbi:exported hypothetical protein [Desulfamplus magnetovallimortis]|uniref:Uncharacterized protein n=1 Tax=Desulfamplus magnetovallimortis TaxID=1246637 RepID=A0A1W1HJ20_9BACT|nr:hypothetical protein [Desulfamplus magnetovallimortis]SLM32405.1 exported hypothetical protein [Desulfamplus magnetovallimortis]